LKDVSFDTRDDQTIGIVGPTGSGKTNQVSVSSIDNHRSFSLQVSLPGEQYVASPAHPHVIAATWHPAPARTRWCHQVVEGYFAT